MLDTFVTDDDGYYLSAYLPIGAYRLLEISAPEGYVIGAEDIVVTVVRDETVCVEPVNSLDAGWFEIQKKDDKGGNIGPAAFNLYDADNNLVEDIVMDSEGYYHSGRLPSGEYSLVETSAPDQYILDATPIGLTIAYQETARVEPVNYPEPVIEPDPPETPETPDTPDTPEIPEIPDTPETPDNPADPPADPSGPSGNTPDPASPTPSDPSEPSKPGRRDTPDAVQPPPAVNTTILDTPPGLAANTKLPQTGGNFVKLYLAYGAGISALIALAFMLRQKRKK